ncbi:MAG: hypothetical protein KBT19_04910 [Lachnospiraceae bacterium]|nr:hypothetical protein [Candidatus Colinaster equi]
MPWCPNCKNEYKEGYTVCSDCGATLVDSLSDVLRPIYFSSEEIIDGILSFLKANGIDSCQKKTSDDSLQFELWGPEDSAKDIASMIAVFLKENMSNDCDECNSDSGKEDEYAISHYKDAFERANEYKSGAFVLLTVGIIGMVALVLLNMGILPFAQFGNNKILISIVMGILFAIFIIVGCSSYVSYGKLKAKGIVEKELKERIFNWAENELDVKCITSQDVDSQDEENNYFSRIAIIKKCIEENFDNVDIALLNYLAEEIYDNKFGE